MPIEPAKTIIKRGPVLVDLALQGGGSHGAFTWGVLDRLLEEPWPACFESALGNFLLALQGILYVWAGCS